MVLFAAYREHDDGGVEVCCCFGDAVLNSVLNTLTPRGSICPHATPSTQRTILLLLCTLFGVIFLLPTFCHHTQSKLAGDAREA